MPACVPAEGVIGIDFGTTNSVVALSEGEGGARLVDFAIPGGTSSVFRSALCFWQGEAPGGAVSHAAGPWAIAEFLEYPQDTRFLQSFKSVAASSNFEHATLFGKRFRFEDLGRIFLEHLLEHGKDMLRQLPERIVVGRPVRYAGSNPDMQLARTRYDAMFSMLGSDIHYVYEPIGAAYSFASRLADPATLMVADFGGGTSDFSIVRVEAPGAARRCVPLGSTGIGIAGDRFDYRIMDRLVLPILGKGGTYRSFDKVLEIPGGHFADFGDWSRLALMRNRRTLEELSRMQRSATDPAAIGRMIDVVEEELGHPLYEAVGQLKRSLSTEDRAGFRFENSGLSIEAEVERSHFEDWIAPDLKRIGETVDAALAKSGMDADRIDHVFLTGGSSLIPAVRRLFETKFGEEKIDSGEELTSIAHGLALIGAEPNLHEWSVDDE